MNCTEFKIWLDSVTEEKAFSLDESLQAHANSCESCRAKIEVLHGAIHFMNSQKSVVLGDKQTSNLIEQLVQQSLNSSRRRQNAFFSLSRIVAAAVIVIGLLVGSITGTLITNRNTLNSNPWSSEFTTLSDNAELISYVFE